MTGPGSHRHSKDRDMTRGVPPCRCARGPGDDIPISGSMLGRNQPERQGRTDALTDDTTGCFVVTTQSASRYWLDLDRRLLRRVTSLPFQARLHLRRDCEDIDLVQVVDCRLGHPMVLLINLNLPGVSVTARRSTPVVRIEAVPEVLVRP